MTEGGMQRINTVDRQREQPKFDDFEQYYGSSQRKTKQHQIAAQPINDKVNNLMQNINNPENAHIGASQGRRNSLGSHI
jgi:hypothetical protein